MERAKVVRRLRIAWSLWWGILCVPMVAWWVRSFSYWDEAWLKLSNSNHAHLISAEGRMIIWFENESRLNRWFELEIDPVAQHRSLGKYKRHSWRGLYVSPSGNTHTVCFAHCFLAMAAAAIAAFPWCPTRFGIRGLLAVTTIVAAIIGGVVWADSFY